MKLALSICARASHKMDFGDSFPKEDILNHHRSERVVVCSVRICQIQSVRTNPLLNSVSMEIFLCPSTQFERVALAAKGEISSAISATTIPKGVNQRNEEKDARQ